MRTKPEQTPGNRAALDREAIIGRALSRLLAQTGPADNCPAASEMARFLDDQATEEERQRILGHLAVCGRCREIHRLAHELTVPEPSRNNRKGWYLITGALATAALVVLAIRLTVQPPATPMGKIAQAPVSRQQTIQPAPEERKQTAIPPPAAKRQPRPHPFSPTMAARRLARTAPADSLAASIGVPASSSYGFAGNSSHNATAFKAGKELFELELWLAAGDRERAGLAGERLAPLLRSIGRDELEAPLNDLQRQLEQERDTPKRPESLSQLEALLKTGQGELVRLGSWAAAARLARGMNKDPYFSGNPPARFRRGIGPSLPPRARTTLKKLSNRNSAKDEVAFRKLLDELEQGL